MNEQPVMTLATVSDAITAKKVIIAEAKLRSQTEMALTELHYLREKLQSEIDIGKEQAAKIKERRQTLKQMVKSITEINDAVGTLEDITGLIADVKEVVFPRAIAVVMASDVTRFLGLQPGQFIGQLGNVEAHRLPHRSLVDMVNADLRSGLVGHHS